MLLEPRWITDMELRFRPEGGFAEGVELAVGANNLFDVYPDKIKASPVNPIYALSGALNDGQVYPRSGGPFGINGGFYYVRVAIDY
mgnify:CR=1 FL=1